MESFFDTGEAVRYRLKKVKTPILFMAVFFPVWLYFGVFIARASWAVVFLGKAADKTVINLVLGLAGLLVFIGIILIVIQIYSLNQLVITDRRVYVRRGIIGRMEIASLHEVRAFRHVNNSSRKSPNDKIWFYLECGEVIKTGELFITRDSLLELLGFLRENFEGRVFSKDELREMKRQSGFGHPIRKTNAALAVLPWLPAMLAALYVLRYLTI